MEWEGVISERAAHEFAGAQGSGFRPRDGNKKGGSCHGMAKSFSGAGGRMMSTRSPLLGTSAIVTGAGSGLGKVMATALAEAGASVLLVDQDEAASPAGRELSHLFAANRRPLIPSDSLEASQTTGGPMTLGLINADLADPGTRGVSAAPPGTRTLTATPLPWRSSAMIAASASCAAFEGP